MLIPTGSAVATSQSPPSKGRSPFTNLGHSCSYCRHIIVQLSPTVFVDVTAIEQRPYIYIPQRGLPTSQYRIVTVILQDAWRWLPLSGLGTTRCQGDHVYRCGRHRGIRTWCRLYIQNYLRTRAYHTSCVRFSICNLRCRRHDLSNILKLQQLFCIQFITNDQVKLVSFTWERSVSRILILAVPLKLSPFQHCVIFRQVKDQTYWPCSALVLRSIGPAITIVICAYYNPIALLITFD